MNRINVVDFASAAEGFRGDFGKPKVLDLALAKGTGQLGYVPIV